MIKRYPHIATIVISTDAGTDAQGYPLPSYERTITLDCRAEPNTSNAIINTSDGTAYNFKYVVYIKKGQETIPVGARITQIEMTDINQILLADNGQPITDENGNNVTGNALAPLGAGIVKMYYPGQLNARLWV